MKLLGKKIFGFWVYIQRWYTKTKSDRHLLGLLGAFRWHSISIRNQICFYLRISPRTEPVRLSVLGLKHPIFLRPKTTDYDVFRQVFVDVEYANVETLQEVKSIIDCGANIGLASVYFLNRFPGAKVVAVEPDPDNIKICRLNLEPYGDRSELLMGGVWGHRCQLVVLPSEYGDGNKWGIQVRPVQEGDEKLSFVEAFDIPFLLDRNGFDKVDILKIDIERSELSVFSMSTDRWLPKVKNLVIELHGIDCTKTFESAMAGYIFNRSYRGDLTYCFELKRCEVGQ